MSELSAHLPVLLDEAIEALAIKPEGIYIDGTFGRGGHSRAILARLGAAGRLIAVDKDPQAIEAGHQLAQQDARFSIEAGSFVMLEQLAQQHGMLSKVDGLLLDLGVSSPQLDEAARGFSFMQDGPLDMRMDPHSGMSAAQWLAVADEREIADVLWRYGEERFSRRIARLIVQRRLETPITRTLELAALIASAVSKREKHKHPATRSFQAIRIFINRELEDLQTCLEQTPRVLAPAGRLVVISFHSLEDRMVKRYIRRQSQGIPIPRGLPVRDTQTGRTFNGVGKAVRAGAAEAERNPRARSAMLRIAERIA